MRSNVKARNRMSGVSHDGGANGVIEIDNGPNACVMVLIAIDVVVVVVVVIVIGRKPDEIFESSEGGAAVAAMSQAPEENRTSVMVFGRFSADTFETYKLRFEYTTASVSGV